MRTNSSFFKIVLLCTTVLALVLGCNNPGSLLSVHDGSDRASQVPPPPGSDEWYAIHYPEENVSARGTTGGSGRFFISQDELEQARKTYLEILFAFIERESGLSALFFLGDSQLDITSYDESRVPLAGSYEGTRQIAKYFRRLFRELDIQTFKPQYQLAQDDYVSSHINLKGTFKDSGQSIDMEVVLLFEFGKFGYIQSARLYYDTELWTRAYSTPGTSLYQDTRNSSDDYEISTTEYDVAEKVQTVYDNFYAGNIPAVMALLSPNTAVYFKGDPQSYPYAGIYYGPAGVLEFIQNLAGTASPYNIEMFMVSEGDRTDVVLFEEWTVFATGKSYHVHTVNSWRIGEDGLLLGFSNYPDSHEIAQAYIP